jgi:MoxR-like ATPase
VVITSNSERRLPEPFLRRCIFHHIEFTEELLRRAVEARVGDFPNLASEVREEAIQRFLELRGRDLRKKPATAELLVWLTLLSARGGVTVEDLRLPLRSLPALAALVKDRDDLALLS